MRSYEVHPDDRAAIHSKHRTLTICGEKWEGFPCGGNWQYPGWIAYRLHDAPGCIVWELEQWNEPSCQNARGTR